MYEPKPIDTSDIILPEELLSLTEKLLKMFMMCGLSEGYLRAGYMVQKKIRKRRFPHP